jgi:hypothetical protein
MKNAFIGFSLLAALCACQSEIKKPVAAAPPAAPTTPPPPPPLPGPTTQTTCYQLVTKTKDVSSCQISQDEKGISGYYDWAPNEKDGGHGILRNVKQIGKDTLFAEYLYVIEGNTQIEEKYFVRSADKLTELTGELIEVKGSNPIKLVPKNKKKLTTGDVLLKVDCSKVAGVVKNIQSMGIK